ncbi:MULTISPECIES: hypothetical protein [unclassified Lysobacter]|uniref:hypothetical protein n=1 Tax=unclassified Lysobacter TaxID=2635362 RepID=UPI001BE98733|nr:MULTISPECIES: hypothetical protein [unclassified Lysobacter]MBT2748111.1 hypothetical protein [Lysobacter sp. ISL-42]MBT2754151.1 hypothetical protein [Lysobacter sp. ISL-50]MBT2776023.1 hypothetical protein [Lysobacter sp. ISL-54]MBT2784138.1 hypothetical protein [Lysobacter sp. ISL-52]
MSIKADESRITSRVFTARALRGGSQDGYVNLLMQPFMNGVGRARICLTMRFPLEIGCFYRLAQAGSNSRVSCDHFGFVSVARAQLLTSQNGFVSDQYRCASHTPVSLREYLAVAEKIAAAEISIARGGKTVRSISVRPGGGTAARDRL